MKLFGSTKKVMHKTKNAEKVRRLIPHKSQAYFLNIEPSNLVFLKTYNTEFDEIVIKFTDQNGRLLRIENKFNLTLLVNK